MTTPVVVFDIDGVLADFCYGFTGILEGESRSSGTQQTWNFEAPPGAVASTWRVVDDSTSFWQLLPPLVTNQDVIAMRHLAERAGIFYVTGREDRNNDTFGQTRKWIQRLGLPHGTLILDGNKRRIAAGFNSLIGIVDDKPDVLLELSGNGYPVYAMDWPYNREVKTARVSSVAEFVDTMERKIVRAK